MYAYLSFGHIKEKSLKGESFMDFEKTQYFKDKLIEERRKLSETKDNIDNREVNSRGMYSNELSGYDNHPGDAGTEVFMKEQDEGFKREIDHKLDEIDRSLDLIDEGTYGYCNTCKQEIDEERLEVVPYAKKCLTCKELEEIPIDNRVFETLEEEYSIYYSGSPYDNVIYDREDTYQDLAVDNIVPGDPSMSTGDNIGLSKEDELRGPEKIENISQDYYDETMK